VSREIENPETGVHFEPPQGARTQGKLVLPLLGLGNRGTLRLIKRREEQLPHRVCCCLIDTAE
jgi:hypothetical protein